MLVPIRGDQRGQGRSVDDEMVVHRIRAVLAGQGQVG
jgi:hypothetical protein